MNKNIIQSLTRTIKKICNSPFLIFLIISTSLVFLLFDDYGISYDEVFHKNYGNFILYFYQSLGKNPSAISYGTLYLYGGFYDVVSQSLTQFISYVINQNSIYEIRHAINGWIGLLGFYYLYKIGETIYSRKIALLSIACLLVLPEYFGLLFVNPKDIPFSTFYLGSIYFFIKYFHEVNSRKSKIYFILFSIFTGFTIGIRLLGVLLWLFLTIGILIKWKNQNCENKYKTFSIFISWLSFGTISYLTTLVFWPFLQRSPIKGLVETLSTMSKYPWGGIMKLMGEEIPASVGGRLYLPKIFLYTLPDWMFFIFFIFIIGVIYRIIFNLKNKIKNLKNIGLSIDTFFLFLTGYGALFIIIAIKPVLYNGYRHVLFIFPSIILINLALLEKILKSFPKYFKVIFISLFTLFILDTAWIMARMHPYEYVYFNRLFAGGMVNGAKSSDVEYWATSLKEGSLWLKKELQNDPRSVTVANCAMPVQTDYYLNQDGYAKFEKKFNDFAKTRTRKNLFSNESLETIAELELNEYDFDQKFKYRADINKADYFLTTGLYHFPQKFNGRVIHTIKRMDIPILYIMKK